MEIIVLQGIPGSGKSTRAKELYLRDPKHTVIVSRDALRLARGNYWVPEQEAFITNLEHYMVDTALEMGYTVIADSTNLHPAIRTYWEVKAKQYNCPIRFELINTPLEECIRRDANPDRNHRTGEKVIRDFHERYKDILESKK